MAGRHRRTRRARLPAHRPRPDLRRRIRGSVATGRPPLLLRTSVPGVFAAGDVRAGSTKRVASAVGEGAIAIADRRRPAHRTITPSPLQPPTSSPSRVVAQTPAALRHLLPRAGCAPTGSTANVGRPRLRGLTRRLSHRGFVADRWRARDVALARAASPVHRLSCGSACYCPAGRTAIHRPA